MSLYIYILNKAECKTDMYKWHTFCMSDSKSPLRECRLMSLLPTSSLSAAVIASAHALIHNRANEMLNTC